MALWGDREREREQLGWFERAAGPTAPNSTPHRFELSSRGDRVTGLILEPTTSDSPSPLVLLPHSEAASGQPLPLSTRLVTQGFAVAQIDLPLYGARAEHKLAACVDAGWEGRGEMAALAREFMKQSLSDLARSLDALSKRDDLDAARLGFVGLGLAGHVGARFCAQNSRPRAVVLALSGRRSADPELDTSGCLAAIAPRPLLLLEAASPAEGKGPQDEIPRFLSEALGL